MLGLFLEVTLLGKVAKGALRKLTLLNLTAAALERGRIL